LKGGFERYGLFTAAMGRYDVGVNRYEAALLLAVLLITQACNRTPAPVRVVLLAPPEARRLIQGEVLSFGSVRQTIASGREIQLVTMEAGDDEHYREFLTRFASDLQVVIVSDAKAVPNSAIGSIPICRSCQRTWYAYIPETVEAERREGARVVLDYLRGHDPSS